MNPAHRTLVGLLYTSLVVLGPLQSPVWSYEVETHADISERAYGLANIDSFLAGQLGTSGENKLPGGFLGLTRRTPVEWLREGSRIEDAPLRFLNHFYDPVFNQGLTVGGTQRGLPAPDWALEDLGDIEGQDESYKHAREAYLRSLTEAKPSDREQWLATTFKRLGQVIHLIQDMASPPHTRNDPHAGIPLLPQFGQSSLYEKYLDQSTVRASLPFTGYPVVGGADFRLPRDYWINNAGTGLSQFVNRNFVSEGTNFTRREDGAQGGIYADPALRLAVDEQGRPFETSLDIQTQLTPGLKDRTGNLIEGSLTFFANNFQDSFTGQAQRNERMTTFSLFDRELQRAGKPLVFTLNRYNIEAQAAFLIPRAVGYSAGLLNYFFRGRLRPSFAPGPSGGREIVLRTQNSLRIEPIGPGNLLLLYEDVDGARHLIKETAVPDLGGEIDLPEIQFEIPAEPPSHYIVVYRGKLGLEADAVVARVFGGLPIVAVQERAVLTGEELPWGSQARRKNPNHQQATGSFWAGGSAGVGTKIREVRLEEGRAHAGLFPPKAVLRLNGKDVGIHWRAADDPGFLPERWEVVLSPIPGQTIDSIVVPPPAIWVNDFRTPLIWIQDVIAATEQTSFLGPDGVRIWRTRKSQFTVFHFGDGTGVTSAYTGLDANFVIPLTASPTRVSVRPIGEVAGLAVPQGEVEVSPEDCSFYRIRFIFGWRNADRLFDFDPSTCEVGSQMFWAKNFLNIDEAVKTLGDQPDPSAPPLLTAATFRREFLDTDLQRFLGVGIAPPEYDAQTQ